MSLPRIAIFLPSLETGGAERAAVNLANGFEERDYIVDVVVSATGGPLQQELNDDISVIDLNTKRFVTCLPRLSRYLATERPQALVSVMAISNTVALIACELASVPTKHVLSEQSMPRERVDTRFDRVDLYGTKYLYPRAHGIAAVSANVKRELAAVTGLNDDGIDLIYNPIVTPDLRELAAEPIDHPWIQNNDHEVVLGIGRLSSEKDFTTLVRAFDMVHERRPESRLLLLGDGPCRSSIQRLVSTLRLDEYVQLLGTVTNPYRYMQNASVLALTSRYEGLPTVLVEAMACGCPVLSTDCPGGSSEILEHGTYGPLVPVGDPDAVATALDNTLSDPVGSAKLEKRATDFSVHAAVTGYESLLMS